MLVDSLKTDVWLCVLAFFTDERAQRGWVPPGGPQFWIINEILVLQSVPPRTRLASLDVYQILSGIFSLGVVFLVQVVWGLEELGFIVVTGSHAVLADL